jgi:hypothetical protein
MTDTQPVTKAETRARSLADRLQEAGYSVEIKVERSEPEYYSDGVRVMLPGRVLVHVNGDGPHRDDDRFGFSFCTWLPAKGHRTSTLYAGGNLFRPWARGRKFSKKLSLRELRTRIAIEVDHARYRQQQEQA